MKCTHENNTPEGDGMCVQGCCSKRRCSDCGVVLYIEYPD